MISHAISSLQKVCMIVFYHHKLIFLFFFVVAKWPIGHVPSLHFVHILLLYTMSSSNLLDVPVDHTSTRLASLPPPRPSSSSYISISSPTVNFSASKQASGYVSRITIASRLADRPIAFKLKTNAPQRYSVKPVYGLIQPDQSVDIYSMLVVNSHVYNTEHVNCTLNSSMWFRSSH
jgi:hypothetical protein